MWVVTTPRLWGIAFMRLDDLGAGHQVVPMTGMNPTTSSLFHTDKPKPPAQHSVAATSNTRPIARTDSTAPTPSPQLDVQVIDVPVTRKKTPKQAKAAQRAHEAEMRKLAPKPAPRTSSSRAGEQLLDQHYTIEQSKAHKRREAVTKYWHQNDSFIAKDGTEWTSADRVGDKVILERELPPELIDRGRKAQLLAGQRRLAKAAASERSKTVQKIGTRPSSMRNAERQDVEARLSEDAARREREYYRKVGLKVDEKGHLFEAQVNPVDGAVTLTARPDTLRVIESLTLFDDGSLEREITRSGDDLVGDVRISYARTKQARFDAAGAPTGTELTRRASQSQGSVRQSSTTRLTSDAAGIPIASSNEVHSRTASVETSTTIDDVSFRAGRPVTARRETRQSHAPESQRDGSSIQRGSSRTSQWSAGGWPLEPSSAGNGFSNAEVLETRNEALVITRGNKVAALTRSGSGIGAGFRWNSIEHVTGTKLPKARLLVDAAQTASSPVQTSTPQAHKAQRTRGMTAWKTASMLSNDFSSIKEDGYRSYGASQLARDGRIDSAHVDELGGRSTADLVALLPKQDSRPDTAGLTNLAFAPPTASQTPLAQAHKSVGSELAAFREPKAATVNSIDAMGDQESVMGALQGTGAPIANAQHGARIVLPTANEKMQQDGLAIVASRNRSYNAMTSPTSEWKIDGVHDGLVTLRNSNADGTTTETLTEQQFLTRNADKLLAGTSLRTPHDDGKADGSWKYDGMTYDGNVRIKRNQDFWMPDVAIFDRKQMPVADVLKSNELIVDPATGHRYANPTIMGNHDGSYRNTTQPLFNGTGPKPTDVRQGAAGDCWIEAAMAAVARTRPELLQKRIKENRDGSVTVQLDDNPVTVTRDLPVAKSSYGSPMYGGTTDAKGNPLGAWAQLTEKAFAAEGDRPHPGAGTSGYSTIGRGGWPDRPLEKLTGGKSVTLPVAPRILEQLKSRHDSGQPIVAASRPAPADTTGKPTYEVVANHAYSVERVFQEGGELRIELRNPWGEKHPPVLNESQFIQTFGWATAVEAPADVR